MSQDHKGHKALLDQPVQQERLVPLVHKDLLEPPVRKELRVLLVPKVQQDKLLPELTISVLPDNPYPAPTVKLSSPPLKFKPSQGGVTFGSSISTTGTPPFSSFTLQPGIYQIHLSTGPGTIDANLADTFNPFNVPFPGISAGYTYLQASLNGTSLVVWPMILRASTSNSFDIIAGDRLISVGQPNSLLQIGTIWYNAMTTGDCELVITRLQ